MVNAAVAYSSLGQNDKAEDSLRRALKYEPANAAANFNLGLLLGEQGRMEEAEDVLRKALKTDPKMAAAAYNLGVIVAKRDLSEAVRFCQQAHQLRPDEPRYSHTLAFYQRQQGDTAGAIATLRQALQRSPASFDAAMLLGDIYQQQGDRKAAAAVYREALGRPGLSPQQRAVLAGKLGEVGEMEPRTDADGR